MYQSKVSKQMENKKSNNGIQSDESLCCVCYREVVIYSIGDCNHPICYECCTRMRILCSSTECAICRKDVASVIFTTTSQPYANMKRKTMSLDSKFNIYFENDSIMQSYDKLLEHVCKECNRNFDKFCHLEKHMIEVHEKYFCHLCVSNLKSFTHERKYYTMNLLKIHRSKGDVDDKSYKGHPLCEYCSERYMDEDALFMHLRRKHYYCHFCDADGLQKFYNDYSHLRKHFKDDHFLCEEGDCYYERFTTVFRNNLDLKAHWSQNHSHTVSKQEARQARTVDTKFNVFWGQNNDRGRGGRTNGSSRIGQAMRTEQDFEDQVTAAAALPPSISMQKPVNIRCSEDFPSLHGAPGLPADERKRNGSDRKTMSQRFAEQNKFSVRTGNRNLTQEDFPLLSSRVSVNTSLPTGSVQVSLNRKNPVPNSSPKVSIEYKQQSGRANEHRRPQVSSISHSSNISLASSGARPKISPEEYPSLGASCTYEKPTWVRGPKVSSNENFPKKPIKTEKVLPTKPDFGAIKDFPSLGDSSGNLQKVLNYTGKSSVNVPMKKATPQPTLHLQEETKKKPPLTTKVTTGSKTKKINLSNIFSDSEEIGEDLSMTRLGDYQSVAAKRSSNISIVRQEDLVKSELKIGELAPPKFKKGDFPSLGQGRTDYEDINSNWRRMPSDKPTKNNKKFNSNLAETFSLSNSELPPPKYTFMLPPNFDDRNKTLISTINDLCHNDLNKFNKFKNIAAELRSSQLHYKGYYSQCKAIMGKGSFFSVFPELLALLPDIKTQQGILEEYRKSDGEKGYRVQFAICSTCQQVLLPEDFSAHVQNHVFNPSKLINK